MDEDVLDLLRENAWMNGLYERAADEIERLRAEVLGMAADRDGWKNLSKWGWRKIAELESTNG